MCASQRPAVGSSDGLGSGCALAIQLNLVAIGITHINRQAVVLLHRFFRETVGHESTACLLCATHGILGL
jgi:hypothetical protein